MKKCWQFTRRGWMKTTVTATTAFMVLPRRVVGGPGQTPPSETVYLASIGAGGRAAVDIRECVKVGARMAALCDVDDRQAGKIYEEYPDLPRYKDFRKMLEKEKGIDGVIVGTPDHTHAVAGMAVMAHGKHLYCEKPLAHSIREIRALRDAARKAKVATQLGNQGHASDYMRLLREWITDGAIGNVKEVHAYCGSVYSLIDDLPRLAETPPVPEGLDWDLWLGPAPERPYHSLYLPGLWRRWQRFGTGVIGDWVCHVVDPVFWTLDLGAPETILAEPVGWDPRSQGETFAPGNIVHYTFPAKGDRPAVKLTWRDGEKLTPRPAELEPDRELPKTGAVVIGSEGTITYGSHGASSCRIIPEKAMQAYARPEPTLPRSPGHHLEWLQACKGEIPAAGSNFDYGAPLTEIALLGVIAMRHPGETLRWDGEKGLFIGSDSANGMLEEPYRKGWTL